MLESDKGMLTAIMGRISQFSPEELPVAEEVIDAALLHPGRDYTGLVIDIEGKVSGFVIYGPTPLTHGTFDMYWLMVAPELQGNGAGKALVQAAEADMVRNGARLAVIETSSTPIYETARQFYVKRGYTLTCRLANFYAPGDDKIIFIKQLYSQNPS